METSCNTQTEENEFKVGERKTIKVCWQFYESDIHRWIKKLHGDDERSFFFLVAYWLYSQQRSKPPRQKKGIMCMALNCIQ